MSADLAQLEKHLSTRSYVEGYEPSQADVHVFESLKTVPTGEFPHAARWYTHIKSWEAEHSSLAGSSEAGKVFTSGKAAAAPAPAQDDDEDDVDLFGEDEEEDEETKRIHEERVAAYNAKKAGKTKPAAKSVVTMDVKPWDDETDMVALEKSVRSVEKEGLVWGASSLVAIGYGIKKLQINLVIEDDKIGLDDLQEQLTSEFEDYIQSTDIAAMQKL